ncbi:rhodanese-like domain-containing protein [Spiroplasma sp. ChiS]|uniref:rhodanese-like domain-containing protein n=1 Tax=Spiroplasma sp. ChiS TaxID=2099885 RepID=UPI000CF90184|nr:rhodanese-like domain-containing protein [Spiroplasma sp. ChiS]PQP78046.1 rhodanese-like domain-containing protein [Spiroplasma sp. ChiS]
MNQKAVYMNNETFETQKDHALLLYVRTNVEFKALRQIPNSINVYIFDLLQDPPRYLSDKNQLIITLCNGGNRSSETVLELRQLGYHNAYVLTTGIYGYYRWKEQKTKK